MLLGILVAAFMVEYIGRFNIDVAYVSRFGRVPTLVMLYSGDVCG